TGHLCSLCSGRTQAAPKESPGGTSTRTSDWTDKHSEFRVPSDRSLNDDPGANPCVEADTRNGSFRRKGLHRPYQQQKEDDTATHRHRAPGSETRQPPPHDQPGGDPDDNSDAREVNE